MKTYLTIIALLIAFAGYGQTTIKKNSIDSGGDISTNGMLKIVYTIGEVALQENTTGNIYISEGFISVNSLVSLDIENYSLLSDMNIYPNPAHNFIIVESKTLKVESLQILDITGKIVLSSLLREGITQSQSIDITTLESGIYFVKVGMQVQKIIKK